MLKFWPFKTDYKMYIKSDAWRKKAQQCRTYAGFRCQLCNSGPSKNNPLEAHHRTYERLGKERAKDLICLCRECHTLFHNNRRLD